MVTNNSILTSWDYFNIAVVQGFVPRDHIKRSHDRLRSLRQSTSVSKYLAAFCGLSLPVPNMNEGEKIDRFIEDLKHNVRVQVLKGHSETFEDCVRVALNVDSAICRARAAGSTRPAGGNSCTPM